MYMRILDLSHKRDATKKATHRRKLDDEQPISSGIKSCRPKAADVILVPTKLRKQVTALMKSVDSSNNETGKDIDKAEEDCNYKPTKEIVGKNNYEKVRLCSVTNKSCILADCRMISICQHLINWCQFSVEDV